MIIHLLRLIWNNKKRNSLLGFQLFIGFLLVFILITLATHNITKYIQPLGFQYQDRWKIECSSPSEGEYKLIYDRLASDRSIKISGASGGTPYFSSNGSSVSKSEFTGKDVKTEELHVDLAYKDVLGLTMEEGRWFNESDLLQDPLPIVISSAYKDAFLGDADLVKYMKDYHIVGVIKNFRRLGELDGEIISKIKLMKPEVGGSFIIQVPPGSGIEFEEKLVGEIKSVNSNALVKILPLEVKRAEYLKQKLTPLLAIAGIGLFLFINVLLGLFGVLWYSISRRTSEIGLRRAIGATARNVSLQFVSEMLVLASMGIIPGIVVAFQFQVFNLLETDSGTYTFSIISSALLILVLVALCAAIPGIKSTRIKPVEALADE